MYVINTICYIKEEDVYEDGCQPDTGTDGSYTVRLSAPTVSGILAKFADHLGVPVAELEVDPCDDDKSRVSAQRLENNDGFEASAAEIEKWKTGALRLWLANYDAYVLIQTPADLTVAEIK